MVDAIKKLGNMIVTAVKLDLDADDSATTSTYSGDDSKPLPELPIQNQTQAKEQSTDIEAPATHREREEETSPFRVDEAEVSKHQHANLKIVIERKVQIPSSLADQVNVVFPSLTEDIKEALGVDYAKTAPEVPATVDEHQNQPGFKHSKASNPELYTDLPTDFTPEMKSMRQEVTEEVRDFGGGYYLHPKKIVDIPPELSHQVRTLHDTLNQEVPHGAEHLHPKEIVEIPPELSQDIRALHEALSQEVENGPDVLHPKELVEIPPELSPEIRELQNELKAEVKSGADVLHPKRIVEIPADLGQEAQELHGALNEEVKQFGDLNHLHPKQIVEIPKELSQEVEKMHEALNEEVIQVGGPGQLHPKQIVEIPAEITPQIRELHADLTEEVTYVGGRHILHPKVIAEVPAELSEEVKYLHEDLNSEVKEIGSTILHPKQIAVIPKDLCQEVKEAHIFVNEDIKNGAQVLHPKEIVEIPSDLNQQTRELHEGLNVEVELFGGASRLQKEDRTLEPPKELSESVKEILPSLAAEIKEFNGPHKLHYYCIPSQNKEHPGTTPKLDIDSFQTHVEQMLLLFGAADSSGTDLSASSKPASGNPVLDECVENVVNALVEGAKKLRGPMTDTDILVEELHRRRSIIDVDDGAPAKEQNVQVLEDQALVGEPANLENAEQRENGKTDSGLAEQDQNVEEPAMAPITEDDKEVLKKPNIMRRLSGWKASHATLNDEDASDAAYTHAKGMENAKGNDSEDVKRPGRKMSWNPFRKHHKHHADVASVPVV